LFSNSEVTTLWRYTNLLIIIIIIIIFFFAARTQLPTKEKIIQCYIKKTTKIILE